MAAVLQLSKKTVSVGPLMTTDKPNAIENEPWYRNPWVWLVIAIPGLTVIGGLVTMYLAITNPHIMVSDPTPVENTTTSTQ